MDEKAEEKGIRRLIADGRLILAIGMDV